MHNIMLIARREYLEAVRTKAFMIMTLLTPVFMFGFSVVPSLLMGVKGKSDIKIMIVTSQPEYANAVKDRMEHKEGPAKKNDIDKINKNNDPGDDERQVKFVVQTSMNMSDMNKNSLLAKLDTKELDGILWLDDKAISDHEASFYARDTNNVIALGILQRNIRDALMKKTLMTKGMTDSDIKSAMQPFDMQTIKWEKGKATKSNEFAQMLSAIFLTLAMYMTVLIYGIGVMRSVLEEKKSRIMEVLMSTVTAMDLMAGKIIGVAMVGITQIAIWTTMGAAIGSGLIFSAAQALKGANLSLAMAGYFAIFFMLGYLLYASMCAALGAMCNSEQEAQQLQTLVLMPMIVSMMMMMLVITQPDHPIVMVMSMFPFTAPILMYTRLVVSHPPGWQVLTSIGILIVTIFIVLSITSRIYRVGILMYGKKPTLPELMKWIKYS